jgi:hypothetical protein
MRVKIGNWANPRAVYEKNGRLFLQVAKGCIDCPICQSRVSFVSGLLHTSRIDHEVIANQSRTVVDVGLPKPPKGKGVAEYLQEILGLPVSLQ